MRYQTLDNTRDVLADLGVAYHDSATIGGALTAGREPTPASLAEDPFGRLFPARSLRVEAGLIGNRPTPIGTSIQRYAGSQWLWDRFSG